MDVNTRIEKIRQYMKERQIDIYYVPNEDDHLSEEYTAAYYQCKSYLSGFSGEAGCTIVTKDFAGLWTDGRYFTQAENELAGTCVTLMRLRQPGVLDPIDYLIANTPENGVLGYDGNVVSAKTTNVLKGAIAKKNAKIYSEEDLVNLVWGDERPSKPSEEVFVLGKKWVGEDASERIAKVRQKMAEKNADILVLTALEDPCWLFNVRGNDIPCTPVTYAYAIVGKDTATYYVDLNKVNSEVEKYLNDNGVAVKSYESIEADLAVLHHANIWVDLSGLNTNLYHHIAANNTILDETSPVVMFRAIKNKTEVEMMHNAQVKDGVAMVKFIKWVKENVQDNQMSEYSAQNKLYELRAEQQDYIEPSFTTICAYQENGAMMHYSATKENHAHVDPKGFLLVDSGGTYKDGTTDITRTIAVGELSDLEKKYYTLVLKGHIDLAMAKFLYGTTGNNLDILARGPLWNINIDYQCGTGHGVGHVLGVHEGPHGIRWGMPSAARPAVPLEENMVVTDEPGVYLPHELGIRIENDLLVVKGEQNFYGQFLEFEHLTYCPYDLEAIDSQYLNDDEIAHINTYHKMVYEKLCPYLNDEEKTWLRNATKEITK